MSWSELNPGAKAFRVAHAAFAIVSMSSLAYVWLSAITRRRDRLLAGSLAVLSFEAVGPVHRPWELPVRAGTGPARRPGAALRAGPAAARGQGRDPDPDRGERGGTAGGGSPRTSTHLRGMERETRFELATFSLEG